MSNARVSACHDLILSKVLTIVLWNDLTIKGNGLTMDWNKVTSPDTQIKSRHLLVYSVYFY